MELNEEYYIDEYEKDSVYAEWYCNNPLCKKNQLLVIVHSKKRRKKRLKVGGRDGHKRYS